jgi:hypothetical protein
MLGFQASNRGTLPAIAWFEHVKLEAGGEAGCAVLRINGLVVGLAGAELGPGRSRQEVGACIWL